jgi:class 3 adenylate cyclase
LPSATVLFVDIPNYATVAERLDPQELSELVKKFYGSANDTAHLFGARYMQFIGEGLLAVFSDDTNTRTVNHGLRAARTALSLVESGYAIRQFLETTYPSRALPPFAVNVALNSGPVTLTLLQDALHGDAQKLPVGEVVTTAMQLQRQAQGQGWPIAMSVATLRMVTGAVRTGRRALLALPGRAHPLDAAELVALALPADTGT